MIALDYLKGAAVLLKASAHCGIATQLVLLEKLTANCARCATETHYLSACCDTPLCLECADVKPEFCCKPRSGKLHKLRYISGEEQK